ncbi:hypothetical protein FRC01_006476 [Tulasnella sp. 417]|nr:hypothetical protein FRC01_006476 [Tulasnella sp. 417]
MPSTTLRPVNPFKSTICPSPRTFRIGIAPESTDPNNGDYYTSIRALGVLFRAVQLGDPEPDPIEEALNQEGFIRNVLQVKVFDILKNSGLQLLDSNFFRQLFARFSYELKYQCATHSLVQGPNSRLNEEEVVIGTILCKSTTANESRKRRNLMERLAKQSQNLVEQIKWEILGDRSFLSPEEQLARAWTCLDVAWEVARANKFGKNSFTLVALTSVLDALQEIETQSRTG